MKDMDLPSEQISSRQKETWNKFSPGWEKWDDLTMDISKAAGDEIIRLLKLKGNESILDVASGTGEPGLTMAQMLKEGKVTGIDQSEGMLRVARKKAEKKGIRNYETVIGEVSRLPFEDNTFDAISCRYGFMFFPDMSVVTKELVRVLKPGGKIAVAVWDSPEKNFWVTAIMGTIMEKLQVSPPPPGAPGMFRCAKKGFMVELFRQAGLKNVSESEVPAKLNCETALNYWNFMTEVGAAVVVALRKADAATREEIKNEVIQKVQQKYPGDRIAIDAASLVICGEK